MENFKEEILSICAFLDVRDYSKETIKKIELTKRLLLSIDDSALLGNTELRLICIFCKGDASVFNILGLKLWNKLVQARNVSKSTEVCKVSAFGRELCFLTFRKITAQGRFEDDAIYMLNMMCRLSEAFCQIGENTLADLYLIEASELAARTHVLGRESRIKWEECVILIYGTRLALNSSGREFEAIFSQIVEKFRDTLFLKIIDHAMDQSEKCFLSVLRCENVLGGWEKTMVLTKALCTLVKKCDNIEELKDTVEGRVTCGVSDFIESGEVKKLTSRCNNLSLVISAINLMKRLKENEKAQHLLVLYSNPAMLEMEPSDTVLTEYICLLVKEVQVEQKVFDLLLAVKERIKKSNLVDHLTRILCSECDTLLKQKEFRQCASVCEFLKDVFGNNKQNFDKFSMIQARCHIKLNELSKAYEAAETIKNNEYSLILQLEIALLQGESTAEILRRMSLFEVNSGGLLIESARLLYEGGQNVSALEMLKRSLHAGGEKRSDVFSNIFVIASQTTEGIPVILEYLDQGNEYISEKSTRSVIFDAIWNACIRCIEESDQYSSFKMSKKVLELCQEYSCDDEMILLFSFVALHAFWNMRNILDSNDLITIESIISLLQHSSKDVGIGMGRVTKRMRLEKGGRGGFSSDKSIVDAIKHMIQKSKIVLCILRNEFSDLDILASSSIVNYRILMDVLGFCLKSPYEVPCTVYGVLVQKIIDMRMKGESDKDEFSESEFARLYRGLVICTLQSQDNEASMLLLKQAQEIILLCDKYPEDEVEWIVITIFNYGQSLRETYQDNNLVKQVYEISLMICTRIKDESKRREYEEEIRRGYMDLLAK